MAWGKYKNWQGRALQVHPAHPSRTLCLRTNSPPSPLLEERGVYFRFHSAYITQRSIGSLMVICANQYIAY